MTTLPASLEGWRDSGEEGLRPCRACFLQEASRQAGLTVGADRSRLLLLQIPPPFSSNGHGRRPLQAAGCRGYGPGHPDPSRSPVTWVCHRRDWFPSLPSGVGSPGVQIGAGVELGVSGRRKGTHAEELPSSGVAAMCHPHDRTKAFIRIPALHRTKGHDGLRDVSAIPPSPAGDLPVRPHIAPRV